MGKKKDKHIPPPKKIFITGTVSPSYSERTVSPETSFDELTSAFPLNEDSTSAPSIGEEDNKEYVNSTAGLADKYLFSKKAIPFSIILIICAIVSGVIYIQDNQSGSLTGLGSVLWTISKCFVFLLMTILFRVILSVADWVKNKVGPLVSRKLNKICGGQKLSGTLK